MGSSASSTRNAQQRRQQQQAPPPQQQQQPQQQPMQYQQQHQQPPQQQQQRPPAFPNNAPPPVPMANNNVTPPPQQAGVAEAQTLKNICAVTPESVKFDPVACLLHFETNCAVPASLEVHVAVRCDVMHGNCMITPNKPKPPPPKIPVPIGQRFHEIPVDLTNITEQERKYIAEYPKQIPLVLELSYTAPADEKNSEPFAMAEFTMIQLQPAGKVVKALLRARDGVYKVENLFGGEHADIGTVVVADDGVSPASANSDVPTAEVDDDEEGLCIICLTNDKTTIVMPCRHLCLCKECAEELRQRGPKCPVCRGPISQMIAVK